MEDGHQCEFLRKHVPSLWLSCFGFIGFYRDPGSTGTTQILSGLARCCRFVRRIPSRYWGWWDWELCVCISRAQPLPLCLCCSPSFTAPSGAFLDRNNFARSYIWPVSSIVSSASSWGSKPNARCPSKLNFSPSTSRDCRPICRPKIHWSSQIRKVV